MSNSTHFVDWPRKLNFYWDIILEKHDLLMNFHKLGTVIYSKVCL